jgi:hypothetical protein
VTRRLIGAIAFVAFTVVAGPANGQSEASSGQIAGRVLDSSGAVIPGVVVAIVNEATSIHREAVTNAEGQYAFPLLPIGTYALVATLKGFQSVREPNLQVTVGSALRRDLILQVGDVRDTVNVGTDPPSSCRRTSSQVSILRPRL